MRAATSDGEVTTKIRPARGCVTFEAAGIFMSENDGTPRILESIQMDEKAETTATALSRSEERLPAREVVNCTVGNSFCN